MKFHFDTYVKNWKKKKPAAEDIDLFEDEKTEENPEDNPEEKSEENPQGKNEDESKPEEGAEPITKKPKYEIEDTEEEMKKLEDVLKMMKDDEAGK